MDNDLLGLFIAVPLLAAFGGLVTYYWNNESDPWMVR